MRYNLIFVTCISLQHYPTRGRATQDSLTRSEACEARPLVSECLRPHSYQQQFALENACSRITNIARSSYYKK